MPKHVYFDYGQNLFSCEHCSYLEMQRSIRERGNILVYSEHDFLNCEVVF